MLSNNKIHDKEDIEAMDTPMAEFSRVY